MKLYVTLLQGPAQATVLAVARKFAHAQESAGTHARLNGASASVPTWESKANMEGRWFAPCPLFGSYYEIVEKEL